MYWSIDDQKSAWEHRNIEVLILSAYILSLIFLSSLDIDCILYYYVDQSNGSSIIWW